MPEKPLEVSLTATGQQPDQYTLSFFSSTYPVTINPGYSILFIDELRRLHSVLGGQRDPSRQLAPAILLRNVGEWLWKALLPAEAPVNKHRELLQALRTGHTPLLLTLPEKLVGLPWELLYDPEQSDEQGFVALRRPLLRLIGSQATPSHLTLPLRVLLLISSPPDLGEDSRVDVESERAAIEWATREARETGLLHLLVEDIVTPSRVQQALIRFKPHIVHYIGHGEYNEAVGGTLLWEDERGSALPLAAGRFASLLRGRAIQAVVLHACQTGHSQVQVNTPGMAGTLIKEDIPIVLAQQANFTYESSQRASSIWYTSLASGQTCAEAIYEVRQTLALAERPDWAVPTLQGNAICLMPLVERSASPGPPDPLLVKHRVADLPAPTHVFVGRHREMRTLQLMLENPTGDGPILGIITGPGGVGKSTLAAQAAIRCGRKYKAVLTLSCESYQSIDFFLLQLGECLKRQGAPSFVEKIMPDPKLSTAAKIDAVIEALDQAGPLLLIIDNLESAQHDDHTLRDEALLSLFQKLLTNLRLGGRVLITSRYEVKGLLPNGKFAAQILRLPLDDLSNYEVAQLLLRHPTLARFSESVHHMLISEFGGYPYVYDLLSSKAAEQNLELLIHDIQGRITKEHQQRTQQEWQQLRSQIIEYTTLKVIVNQLDEAARSLLARLSVLQRSYPLAAIEQGLGASRASWQALHDWSLLHYEAQDMSYRLHNLTRHYAEGLLSEQERKQAQIQLASWYQQYAEQESRDLGDLLEAYNLLRAAGEREAASEVAVEIAGPLLQRGLYGLVQNLLQTTLEEIAGSNELLSAGAMRLLSGIAAWQGNFAEAQRLALESKTIAEHFNHLEGQAASLYQLGALAYEQGYYPEAQRYYQESLETAGAGGNQDICAASLYQLGNIALFQSNYDEARTCYQRSLAIAESLGNKYLQAAYLNQLGELAYRQGNYGEAQQIAQQSLTIKEQIGDYSGLTHTHLLLGLVAQEQGKTEEARRWYQKSLAIAEQLDDQRGRARALHQLASIAYVQGNFEEAQHIAQQSLTIKEQTRNQHSRARTLHQLGLIAHRKGEVKEAQELYQQSLMTSEQIGDEWGAIFSRHQLGMLAQMRGDTQKAQELYQQNMHTAKELGDLRAQAMTLHQLGTLANRQKDLKESQHLAQESLTIAGQLNDPRMRAGIQLQLGFIAMRKENYDEALRLAQESLTIAEQTSDQFMRAGSLLLLGSIHMYKGDATAACDPIITAYLLFDSIQAHGRSQVEQLLLMVHWQMDENTFATRWKLLAGERPIPSLPFPLQLLKKLLRR